MTIGIVRLEGKEAYDLIYPDHLAMLPANEQESMHKMMANSSRVWIGANDEKILATWGLVPPTLLSDSAYLWLYVTKHMDEHVFLFIRHSKRAVESMLKEFPTIYGHTLCSNKRALQWLRWLGAEFGEPIDGTIYPFQIKAEAS